MTTPVDTTETEFVTDADWIPGFWNFLLILKTDDLIAELVQKEDQGMEIIGSVRDSRRKFLLHISSYHRVARPHAYGFLITTSPLRNTILAEHLSNLSN